MSDAHHARFLFVACLIAVVLLACSYVLQPYARTFAVIVGGLSLFALIVCGWQALYYGATALSGRLAGRSSQALQVVMALGVPLLFWVYFLREAQSASYISELSPWLLVPMAVFAYASWWAGRELAESRPPFQLFMISATVLFMIAWWFHNGAYMGSAGDGESDWFFDDARRARARATGEYAVRYPLYVAASYVGLWAGAGMWPRGLRRGGSTPA